MIRPVALVIGLGVLALAFVVAAAGEGRLDRLPTQQYFPTSYRMPGEACPGVAEEAARAARLGAVTEFEAEWYQSHLRAAGEPSLYLASLRPRPGNARTYRLTWLRTFHAPVFVRVDTLPNGEMRLEAKTLSGHGGNGPGRVAARVERTLSREEAARLVAMLSTSHVLDQPPSICDGGADGARWIIEANEGGRYSYVNRWTPRDGPVRETGLLLLGFTGWRTEPVY